MRQNRRALPAALLVTLLLLSTLLFVYPVLAQESGENGVYLPMIMGLQPTATPGGTLPPTPDLGASEYRINVARSAGEIQFEEAAVAWFGTLSASQNHADVRVAYNDSILYVYTAVFDRRLWYDTDPSRATLTDWDAVTLRIDTSGASGDAPATTSYKFASQLSWWESRASYMANYQGDGSTWVSASAVFTSVAGWRGDAPNSDVDDRGWSASFRIPFASLGLDAPPAAGTTWRMALQIHDRDGSAQQVNANTVWPPGMKDAAPATWGALRFGLPTHTPARHGSSQQTVIRRPTDNDASVPDADVGGAASNQCPGDSDYIWNKWGNANYGTATSINIQNQYDVADWPCFSRYFVTFPLDSIPPGKVVISATLTMHQFGNAGGPGDAQPSWIQVFTVDDDWQESTITWNNAPLARENVAGAWVNPMGDFPGWPGVPWHWDLSYAAADAYARGLPLRLALYEADSAYHSGKYFVTSDTGDWNTAGRPTLRVTWGDPAP